jgi:two-component system, OmpR family, response regulator CpxR
MSIRVLLVDDEREFVEVLSERLANRGFHVNMAFSGDEALEALQEADPDVVILDVLMPGRDGIETLREIKRVKPLAEVIMLTGHSTVETALEGMRLGAYDYLMKPSDTQVLIAKITKAHQRKLEHEERIRQAEGVRL